MRVQLVNTNNYYNVELDDDLTLYEAHDQIVTELGYDCNDHRYQFFFVYDNYRTLGPRSILLNCKREFSSIINNNKISIKRELFILLDDGSKTQNFHSKNELKDNLSKIRNELIESQLVQQNFNFFDSEQFRKIPLKSEENIELETFLKDGNVICISLEEKVNHVATTQSSSCHKMVSPTEQINVNNAVDLSGHLTTMPAMSKNEVDKLTTLNNSKYLTVHNNETKEAYIDRNFKAGIINKICWNEIEDREYVDCGGAGIILKAKWREKNTVIVLKQVADWDFTRSDNQEFIKEIKAFHEIERLKEKTPSLGYENIIKFFGVSKRYCSNIYLIVKFELLALFSEKITIFSDKSEHYLVLEYADRGDLRHYLSQTLNILDWERKIIIARQIVCGLLFLHENDILHRDLHTRNVVIKSFENDIRVMITDFGLSKVLSRNSRSHQLLAGNIPFIDPKILNGFPLELVAIEMIKGAREKPIPGSKASYVGLYTDCWDPISDKRPDIKKVHKLIHEDNILLGEDWKQELPQIPISKTDQTTSEAIEDDSTLDNLADKHQMNVQRKDKYREDEQQEDEQRDEQQNDEPQDGQRRISKLWPPINTSLT
ncbi:23142_t:CDS:10 [Gigaspora margarita]|uniref:23142_t:CDS:1 n=1 Tax=Gigaspora margarita TaxID=4874 RepID=A0ABN7UIT8_GIGMA|nr:23142_t:CDS:10 [Gigaspora margarita]